MTQFPDDLQQKIYTDLWQKLVQDPVVSYPWDPQTSETYYEQIDSESPLTSYLNSETTYSRAEDFFEQIKPLYPTNKLDRIYQMLVKQFSNLVPTHWLEAIAQRIPEKLNQTSSELEEQLINCVQPLLSNLWQEDLQVLARPLVQELRFTDQCSQPPSLPDKSWNSLSEIEKARISLLIAKIALKKFTQLDV